MTILVIVQHVMVLVECVVPGSSIGPGCRLPAATPSRRPFPTAAGRAAAATPIGPRAALHLVSLNSSRPISIRRISDVPAPIS